MEMKLNNTSIVNYSLYLSQMKSQKKDLSKIPQRVYDRIE